MGAAYTIPFLHTEWLIVAAIAATVWGALLPPWRWRFATALALGAGTAAFSAAAGLVPWWGELHLAAYGIFMLGGFAAAYALMLRRARRIGIDERRLIDMFLIAIIAGLAGARARYVWERPEEFFRDPATHQARPLTVAIARAVDFDRGGMVWYGGMVLAAALVVLYAWRTRVRILALGDIVAPALLLGLGIGRIGCFFNGCCYGHATDLPWACLHNGEKVHPTQLYETIACSLMAGALWWFWTRRRADGQALVLGTIGYGAWRFTNELLRGDDKIPSNLLGLPVDPPSWLDTSQATSLHLIVVAGVGAMLMHWYRRRHPEAWAEARVVPGSRYGAGPALTGQASSSPEAQRPEAGSR